MTSTADLAPQLCQVCPHVGDPERISRCRPFGHIEATGARKRTKCTHKLTEAEASELGKPAGSSCGQPANVTRYRPGPAASPGSTAGDGPVLLPLSWREALAEEYPGAEPCPDHCPCGGTGTIRYTSDHTATVCEVCGPEYCWEQSPAARARAEAHLEAVRRQAIRTGAASPAVSRRELNEQDRALKRRRELAAAVVAKVLEDKYLTAGCRSDWEWFAGKIPNADRAELAELEQEIREQPVNRVGRWRYQFGAGELPAYLKWIAAGAEEDADQEGQEEDQEEAQPAPGPELEQVSRDRPKLLARPRLALPSGSGPSVTWSNAHVPPFDGRSCGICRARGNRNALGRWPAAILRAEASDLQWMLARFDGHPMPELCGPHYAEAAREYAEDHADGSRLLVSEQFDRTAVQQMRAMARTVPVLVNDQVTYQPEWQ